MAAQKAARSHPAKVLGWVVLCDDGGYHCPLTVRTKTEARLACRAYDRSAVTCRPHQIVAVYVEGED